MIVDVLSLLAIIGCPILIVLRHEQRLRARLDEDRRRMDRDFARVVLEELRRNGTLPPP